MLPQLPVIYNLIIALYLGTPFGPGYPGLRLCLMRRMLRCCAQFPLVTPFLSLAHYPRCHRFHPAQPAAPSVSSGSTGPIPPFQAQMQARPPAPATASLRVPRRATVAQALRSSAPSRPTLAGILRCASGTPPGQRSAPRISSSQDASATPHRQPTAPPPCRAGPGKGPTPPVGPSKFGCRPQAEKACHLVKFAFRPRRQKQGPLRGGFH